ncbi:MAG: dihydroorotase [Lachnospiraceae bacterium]|nr:dihydroorotase [Lachnospiraceae bacterium]
MGILIKGGRVIDPATGTDEVRDILIEDGIIKKIGKSVTSKNAEVIDAKDKWVMPGFIDMHVHLRDPGQTAKEDLETGCAAAAAGGFTGLVAMPNTKPPIDNADQFLYVDNKAKALTRVHVYQAGCLTKGMEGKELSDIDGMAKAGCIAFSEDGKSVMNTGLTVAAMKKLKEIDAPFLDHCEDITLRGDGCMNEDENAERLGLPGISNAVENVIAIRDIYLSGDIGSRLHLCHCSTKESVAIVRGAKKEGIKVTAEVCPHHFALTSDAIERGQFMTNYKMNPPLRTQADVDALIQGLKDDVIDVIATDHAPHTADDKNEKFERAPFGIVGLETAAALVYTKLVDTEILTPVQMAAKMSTNPAKILNVAGGSLDVGSPADVVIFDPKAVWTVDKTKFKSKSRNTPFDGMELKGKVVRTIAGGDTIYEEDPS